MIPSPCSFACLMKNSPVTCSTHSAHKLWKQGRHRAHLAPNIAMIALALIACDAHCDCCKATMKPSPDPSEHRTSFMHVTVLQCEAFVCLLCREIDSTAGDKWVDQVATATSRTFAWNNQCNNSARSHGVCYNQFIYVLCLLAFTAC